METKNFNPESEADAVLSSWVSFKNWFEFFGGKEYLKKQINSEIVSGINLTETRSIASVWKDKHSSLDPETIIELERCIYLTLLIEWGDTAKCFFDYSKSEIKFESEDKSLIF